MRADRTLAVAVLLGLAGRSSRTALARLADRGLVQAVRFSVGLLFLLVVMAYVALTLLCLPLLAGERLVRWLRSR